MPTLLISSYCPLQDLSQNLNSLACKDICINYPFFRWIKFYPVCMCLMLLLCYFSYPLLFAAHVTSQNYYYDKCMHKGTSFTQLFAPRDFIHEFSHSQLLCKKVNELLQGARNLIQATRLRLKLSQNVRGLPQHMISTSSCYLSLLYSTLIKK